MWISTIIIVHQASNSFLALALLCTFYGLSVICKCHNVCFRPTVKLQLLFNRSQNARNRCQANIFSCCRKYQSTARIALQYLTKLCYLRKKFIQTDSDLKNNSFRSILQKYNSPLKKKKKNHQISISADTILSVCSCSSKERTSNSTLNN